MKGEEIKGEKKSAALMLAHLISIAPEMGWEVHRLPGLSEIAPFVSQMAQERKKGTTLVAGGGGGSISRRSEVPQSHAAIIKSGYEAHVTSAGPGASWSVVTAFDYLKAALGPPLPADLPTKAAVGRLLVELGTATAAPAAAPAVAPASAPAPPLPPPLLLPWMNRSFVSRSKQKR